MNSQMKLLDELKVWCDSNNKQEFYSFFSTILEEAKQSYIYSKGHAWSIPKNLITIIAFAILPVILSIITFFVEQYKDIPFSGKFWAFVLISAVYFVLSSWLQWYQMKKTPETWVRRSAYYLRLCITLGVFIYSDRGVDDYRKFVKDTFAVLEQNIDQFTLNLSSNGLAEKR